MARAGRAGPHSRAIRPMCRSDPAQHPRLHHLVAVLAGIGAAMARCREIACGKSTNRPASAAAAISAVLRRDALEAGGRRGTPPLPRTSQRELIAGAAADERVRFLRDHQGSRDAAGPAVLLGCARGELGAASVTVSGEANEIVAADVAHLTRTMSGILRRLDPCGRGLHLTVARAERGGRRGIEIVLRTGPEARARAPRHGMAELEWALAARVVARHAGEVQEHRSPHTSPGSPPSW